MSRRGVRDFRAWRWKLAKEQAKREVGGEAERVRAAHHVIGGADRGREGDEMYLRIIHERAIEIARKEYSNEVEIVQRRRHDHQHRRTGRRVR